jgi:hypothetical protein
MQFTRGQKIALGVTAGALAVGGGVFWYQRRRKVNLPSLGGAVSDAVKSGTGTYLGSGKAWTGWDDKTTLPDEAAIRDALDMLGYGSSGCIVAGKWVQSTDCVASLKLFQGDVNQVNAWRRAVESGEDRYPDGDTMIPPALHSTGTGPTLGVDGRAGRATIAALSAAIAAAEFATNGSCDPAAGAGPCAEAWAAAVDFARRANQLAAVA